MPTFSCHYLSVERLPFPLIVFTSAARLSHYLFFWLPFSLHVSDFLSLYADHLSL